MIREGSIGAWIGLINRLDRYRRMIHLTKLPRRDMLALCGQPIDHVAHQRSMLAGDIDCPRCLEFLRALPGGGAAGRRGPSKS